ncbi:hypothetical protein T484DRAFT_1753812 [Baffinella frigidus]|nr:hypothetical protein T484DRAFT_1753812 [Cryptophyta sp. CCMP2293]
MSDTVNAANTAMQRTMTDTTATLVVDDAALQAPAKALPAVMSWPLAPRTAKMDREIEAIPARVYAETDAAIAVEHIRKSPRRPLGFKKRAKKGAKKGLKKS